jgi:hypothetical protein
VSDTLHGYYGRQDVLPTYGGFASAAELTAYERERRGLFTHKLQLPPRLFDGASVLEFGPDAGENSLVFALWGASMSLEEPNGKAHPVIREYFDRFGLSARLASLGDADVEAYAARPDSGEKFGFIDAEGFIYAVRPLGVWMELFARLLAEDGLLVLFYCEAYGSFFELLLKVIHARARELTGASDMETARGLFQAKWDSIPHKRTMESWVMDVILNPFVRLEYLLEPLELCDEMARAGFYLYSSWPRYNDALDVSWFKKPFNEQDTAASRADFVGRSRLAHVFGRKHFLVKSDPSIEATLSQLVALVDGLIDRFDKGEADRAAACLSELERVIESDEVLSMPEDRMAASSSVRSAIRILDLLSAGDVDELRGFCNTDQAFIESWGMPSHFAVFGRADYLR